MASTPAGYQQPPRRRAARRGRLTIAYALLLGECVVILVPSIYGRIAPKLFGIPFFYWFQLMWILAAMVITGVAYLLVTGGAHAPDPGSPGATSAPAAATASTDNRAAPASATTRRPDAHPGGADPDSGGLR